MPLYALVTLVVCVIGDQLESIHHLKKPKDFDQQTSVERFHFCFTLVLTAITVGFIVWSGIVFKQKVELYKEE